MGKMATTFHIDLHQMVKVKVSLIGRVTVVFSSFAQYSLLLLVPNEDIPTPKPKIL